MIGKPFRAHIDFSSSFPVFENQPFLRELDKFILSDMGVHILDVVRFLFGEAEWLICRIQRVNPTIRGEDVATVLLQMKSGMTVTCTLSYASRLERERFPEAFVLIEGEQGSAELAPDFWIRVTNEEGTKIKTISSENLLLGGSELRLDSFQHRRLSPKPGRRFARKRPGGDYRRRQSAHSRTCLWFLRECPSCSTHPDGSIM